METFYYIANFIVLNDYRLFLKLFIVLKFNQMFIQPVVCLAGCLMNDTSQINERINHMFIVNCLLLTLSLLFIPCEYTSI